MSRLKNTDGAKKIHLTTLGNVSNPLEKMDLNPIRTPNINMPSLRFWDYVLNTPFLRPEMMPPGSFFYRNVSTDVIIQSTATNRANKGPKLNYKQWTNDNGYIDQGYYYGDNNHFGYLTDSDGKKYHIQRKSINGWDDEKFWFFDEPTQSYVEFIPTGYTPPSVIYRAYGESLGEFGERYEAAINTCVAIFVGYYSGVVAITLWRTILKMLLNMSLEIVRQVLIEKKNIETLDIADIAIEIFSVKFSKWYADWIFECLKYSIQEVLYVSIKKDVKVDVDLAKIAIGNIVKIALLKHKKETEALFNQDFESLVPEISDKIFSFITSSVIYEAFSEEN